MEPKPADSEPRPSGSAQPDSDSDSEDAATPAHIVAGRSLIAGLATEMSVGLVLLLVWKLSHGSFLPWKIWPYLIASGLLTGAVFAVAELVADRRTAWLGALLVLPLIPAVALGGEFALEVVLEGSPLKAFAKIMVFHPESWWLHLLFLSGALALYTPLLVIRKRGGSVFAQTYGMTAGALVWLGLLVVLPDMPEFEALNLTIYLLPLFVRAVSFPLGLWAADRGIQRLQGESKSAPRHPKAEAGKPGHRHKAKWLDERAQTKLNSGESAEAAEIYERAYQAWPTGGRALNTAKAWVAADEPYKAIDALRLMLDAPRPGPKALGDPALGSLAGLEAFEELKESDSYSQRTQRRRTGLDPRVTLHSMMGCVGAVLLALVVMPIYSPDVPANITRVRLRSLVWTDAEAMFRVGERLESGAGVAFAALAGGSNTFKLNHTSSLIGLSAAFDRLAVPRPLAQDRQAALSWYLRAAEAGHTEAMMRYAHGRTLAGDEAGATHWYRRAAEAGHAYAAFQYGAALRWGKGVKTDTAQALVWYRNAAQRGDTNAMVNLAMWLEVGRGIERDIPQAIRWFEKARDGGHSLGTVELRRLLRKEQRRSDAPR